MSPPDDSTHCGCLCPARQPSCTPLGRPRAKVGIDVVRYIRPDRCPKVHVFASYREPLPLTTGASSAARTKSDRGQPRCDNVETCVCKITKAATPSDTRATPHSGTATRKATLRAEEPAGGPIAVAITPGTRAMPMITLSQGQSGDRAGMARSPVKRLAGHRSSRTARSNSQPRSCLCARGGVEFHPASGLHISGRCA
jgi:hypothetical protein